MRKIKKITPWILLLLYLIILLPLVGAKRKEIKCDQIMVRVLDNTKNQFVEESEIERILTKKGEFVVGKEMLALNTNYLENILMTNTALKQVDVYRTLQGTLKVRVKQRNPVLRVINNRQESFYIDDQGTVMPVSEKFTAHVLVASGNISHSYAKLHQLTNQKVGDNSVDKYPQLILDLYELANYIYHDKFWRAQIEQVYVVNGGFELIPRVGTHIIQLGTIENYELKFRNLKALYEQGLSKAGWNNYKTINLKYNNQVICTKR